MNKKKGNYPSIEELFKDFNHPNPNINNKATIKMIEYWPDESLTRFMNSKGYSILHTSNVEDSLRGEPLGYPSYLTSVFKKG